MDQEEQEGGISLGEIVKSIGKRIWIILGISVLVTVIVLMFEMFLLDKTQYVMSFTISYPEQETSKYPNGMPFYYQDIISLDRLNDAKKTDEKFAKLDVEKMTLKDGISISAQTRETQEGIVYSGTYTVTVDASYFSQQSLAGDFLKAVANRTVLEIQTLAKADFAANIKIYDSSDSFDDKLSSLVSQSNTILNQYNNWIELFEENYNVTLGEKNVSLKTLEANASTVFNSTTQRALEQELQESGYVPEKNRAQELERIKARINRLDQIIADLEEGFAGLGSQSQYVDMGESYWEYVAERSDLLYKQAILSTDEGFQKADAFVNRLTQYRNQLENTVNTLASVSDAIYRQETIVRFASNSVTSVGGNNLMLYGVAGFIITFVLASAVVVFVDRSKSGKKQEGASKSAPSDESEDRED